MSAFKKAELDERYAPPEILLVSPEHWSPKWGPRPLSEVASGIRPLSGADDDYCRSAAAKIAWRLLPGDHNDRDHDARTDAYNDALMRIAITRATCDANDARKSWDVWKGAPDDVVGVALTREGVKAIYDAIERITISLSPVRAEAEDEDLAELGLALLESLDRMPAGRASRARRLALFLLEEARAYPEIDEPAEVASAEATAP